MTPENPFADSYRSQDRHPKTGILSSHPGPENRYATQSPNARAYAAKMGQILERNAGLFWSQNPPALGSRDAKYLRAHASSQHQFLYPLLSRRIYYRNAEVDPHYLTLASPLLGSDFTSPLRMPQYNRLPELVHECGSIFGTAYPTDLANFLDVGVEDPETRSQIRYVIESAQALARLTVSTKPLGQNDLFIPNVWTRNVAQFDGVVLPLSTNHSGKRTDLDIVDFWTSTDIPYRLVEEKFETRVRYNSGFNTLNRGPLNRHLLQFQTKMFEVIAAFREKFRWPESVVFYYFRGTMPNITHAVQFDYPFLATWQMGLIVSLDQNNLSPEEIDDTRYVISAIGQQLEVIKHQDELRRQKIFVPYTTVGQLTVNGTEIIQPASHPRSSGKPLQAFADFALPTLPPDTTQAERVEAYSKAYSKLAQQVREETQHHHTLAQKPNEPESPLFSHTQEAAEKSTGLTVDLASSSGNLTTFLEHLYTELCTAEGSNGKQPLPNPAKLFADIAFDSSIARLLPAEIRFTTNTFVDRDNGIRIALVEPEDFMQVVLRIVTNVIYSQLSLEDAQNIFADEFSAFRQLAKSLENYQLLLACQTDPSNPESSTFIQGALKTKAKESALSQNSSQ